MSNLDGPYVILSKSAHQQLVDRQALLEPFVVTSTAGQYDVYATVKGGGTTGT